MLIEYRGARLVSRLVSFQIYSGAMYHVLVAMRKALALFLTCLYKLATVGALVLRLSMAEIHTRYVFDRASAR